MCVFIKHQRMLSYREAVKYLFRHAEGIISRRVGAQFSTHSTISHCPPLCTRHPDRGWAAGTRDTPSPSSDTLLHLLDQGRKS